MLRVKSEPTAFPLRSTWPGGCIQVDYTVQTVTLSGGKLVTGYLVYMCSSSCQTIFTKIMWSEGPRGWHISLIRYIQQSVNFINRLTVNRCLFSNSCIVTAKLNMLQYLSGCLTVANVMYGKNVSPDNLLNMLPSSMKTIWLSQSIDKLTIYICT